MVGYDLPIVALDLARSEQIIDVYYLRGGGVLDTGLFNNFQAVLVKAIALAKSATGNSHTIHHMAAPGIPPGENLGYIIVPTLGRSGRTLERVTMFAINTLGVDPYTGELAMFSYEVASLPSAKFNATLKLAFAGTAIQNTVFSFTAVKTMVY